MRVKKCSEKRDMQKKFIAVVAPIFSEIYCLKVF